MVNDIQPLELVQLCRLLEKLTEKTTGQGTNSLKGAVMAVLIQGQIE